MQPPEVSRPKLGIILRWLLLVGSIGVIAGLSSALFLWSLDFATSTFTRNPQLIYALPVIGVVIAVLTRYAGHAANQGNNAIIRGIKGSNERVALVMAPFILVTTLLTHLFGGSAGREGTAVQMSGSLTDTLLSRFAIPQSERSVYLRAAAAAGFGAIFGTPLAGAVFGMEVSKERKSITFTNLIPCLVASLIGDFTCRLTGVGHAQYALIAIPQLSPMSVLWLGLCGVAIGLLGIVFIEAQHSLATLGTNKPYGWWARPVIGGAVILGINQLLGTSAFNGLGLPLIADALSGNAAPLWTFAVKLAFTVITLGSGFKGGEVTPLFCIGALFGNAFATVTGQDPKLCAGLGFVSLFAAAAKVPLTCWILAMELFGPRLSLIAMLVIGIAYLVSGRRSIYAAQWEDKLN
jgi:H+/Cl- antiporter ClcA